MSNLLPKKFSKELRILISLTRDKGRGLDESIAWLRKKFNMTDEKVLTLESQYETHEQ